MPSRRYRGRKTFGTKVSHISTSVGKVEATAVPTGLGPTAVSDDSMVQGAVTNQALGSGAVDSTSLSLSTYIPSGEGAQRVPAPLDNTTYWGQVVAGNIELHDSGVHGGILLEDIRNVVPTNAGLLLTPTADEDARIYLTGRLPIPRSRKIYATWTADSALAFRLVWWETTPVYEVESVKTVAGVSTVSLNSSIHSFAIGDTIRVTDSGPDYDGINKVVNVDGSDIQFINYNEVYPANVMSATFTASTGMARLELKYLDGYNLEGYMLVQGVGTPFDGLHRVAYIDASNASAYVSIPEYQLDVSIPGSGGTPIGTSLLYTVDTSIGDTEHYLHPFGKASEDIYHYVELKDRQIWGADGYSMPIIAREKTGTTATIYCSNPTYAQAGDTVVISDVDAKGDATETFDGTYTVTWVSTDTYSFQYTSAVSGTVAKDVPAQGTALAVTSNQYNPAYYAVYAEEPAGSVSTPLLGSAKVFEVLGESTTATLYRTVSKVNLTNNRATLTVDSVDSIKVDGSEMTVLLTDNVYGPIFNGTFPIIYADSTYNKIIYALTHANIPNTNVNGVISVITGVEHSELTPTGLTLYDATGGVSVRLSSQGSNFFTAPGATIDSTGTGTFSVVSAQDFQAQNTISVGGSVVGDTFNVDATYSTFSNSVSLTNTSGSFVVGGSSYFQGNTRFASTINVVGDTTGIESTLLGNVDAAVYFSVTDNSTSSIASTANLRFRTSMMTGVLDRFPRGLVYSTRYPGPNTAGTAMNVRYITLATGSFKFEPYRHYMFVVSTGNMQISTATNVETRLEFITAWANATANSYAGIAGAPPGINLVADTYTNATPVKHSSILTASQVGDVSGDMVFDYFSTPAAEAVSSNIYAAGGFDGYEVLADTDLTWALRFAYGNATWTPNAVLKGVTTTARYGVSIFDMGPSSHSMIGNLSGANGTTPNVWLATTAAAYVGGGSTPGKQTVTTHYTTSFTLTTSNTGGYDNYGLRTAASTDPYANPYSIYQGNPGTASGTKKSQIVFPALTSNTTYAARKNNTVAGVVTSNVVISKVELWLQNRHSYSSSGLTAYWGVSASTSIGASIGAPISGSGVMAYHFNKGQGQWVTLSTDEATRFANGTARSVLLGLTDSSTAAYYSSLASYGYFDGDGSGMSLPQLRITYSYDETK